MSVIRSALASRAARFVTATSTPDHRRDFAGECFQPLHALQTASRAYCDTPRSRAGARGSREPLLLSCSEEELGVGETRTHHALVSFDNIGRRFRIDIRYDQEARAQLALRIGQREILLVRLHGEDQGIPAALAGRSRRNGIHTRPATRPARSLHPAATPASPRDPRPRAPATALESTRDGRRNWQSPWLSSVAFSRSGRLRRSAPGPPT